MKGAARAIPQVLGLAAVMAPVLGALSGVPDRPIDGGTSLRQSVESFAQLKHRKDEDLPPLPDGLEHGRPGSVLSPEVVSPVEVLPHHVPVLDDQVKKVKEKIVAEIGDLGPARTDFPGRWPGLESWRPT